MMVSRPKSPDIVIQCDKSRCPASGLRFQRWVGHAGTLTWEGMLSRLCQSAPRVMSLSGRVSMPWQRWG